MLDNVRIQRKTGETTDHVTFKVTPVYTTIYEGIGFTSPLTDGTPVQQRGDSRVAVLVYTVGVPLEGNDAFPNPDFNEGDQAINLTSADPEQVGRVITLESPVPGTFSVYRRLTGYTEQRFV